MQTSPIQQSSQTIQLIGALWVTGGAITIGLSEIAHVLGRVGTRLYAYDGGYAFWIGLALIVVGGVLLVKSYLTKLN